MKPPSTRVGRLEGHRAATTPTLYPGEWDGVRLGFGGDLTGGGTRPGPVDPFYVWASVIEDGRVVATDYAPDVGWLVEPKP